MDLGLTLLGQMITFAIFVAFTMKFVWPALEAAMQERQKRIADGLAAAEKGHLELQQSQAKAQQEISAAKEKAQQLISQANKQATMILEQAKAEAEQEQRDIIAAGHRHIEQEANQARQTLRKDVVGLAIQISEKILQRTIDDTDQHKLVEQVMSEG